MLSAAFIPIIVRAVRHHVMFGVVEGVADEWINASLLGRRRHQ
jgi:hypothetical protein